MINNSNIEEPGLGKYLLVVALSVIVSLGVYVLVLWYTRKHLNQEYALWALCIFTLLGWASIGARQAKKVKFIGASIMTSFIFLNWTSFAFASFYTPWCLVGVVIISMPLCIILSPEINRSNIIDGITNSTLYTWGVLESLALVFGLVVINAKFPDIG